MPSPYRPPLPPGPPPNRIPPWPALRTEAASPVPEVRKSIPEPFPPTPPNIHPGNSQRTSPGPIQRPTPRESPTSPSPLPPIHGHKLPSPRSPPLPGDRPAPMPRLPPIGVRDPESESLATAGQPTMGSLRPPTPSNTPADGSKQRSSDLAQRPFSNTSPSSTTLPPIHRGEPQNQRSPPNSGDQPSRMPSPPPIHVGDSGFESRLAPGATAAEEQPSPRTHRHHNPNWPENWSTLSKGERRRWNRENPNPTPTPPPRQPEPDVPQQTTSPVPKPANWSTMSPRDKEHWLSRHPRGL